MKERISSFLDGELDQEKSIQLIKKLDEDHELRDRWTRYNIYGSAIRDELSASLTAGFSDRVMQALSKEPVQLAPASLAKTSSLRGPVIGFAVAASLLAVAVLLSNPLSDDQQPTQLAVVTEHAVTPSLSLTENKLPVNSLPTVNLADNAIVDTENPDLIVANSKNENVRERINRLLIEHNEYNPASDMTGMWSYSRFVGYNPTADSH